MYELSCKHCQDCPVMCETTPIANESYNKNRCNVDCMLYENNGELPCTFHDEKPHRFGLNNEKIYLTSDEIKAKIMKRIQRAAKATGCLKKKGSNNTPKKKKRKKRR